MEQTWIRDYETEPEYMSLSESEKNKATKRLLIFPIICTIIFIVILIGELTPASKFPSITKTKYLIKANEIASSLISGDTEDVVGHMVAYYDNRNINYSLNGGLTTIKKNVIESLNQLPTASEKISSLMAHIEYRSNETGGYDWVAVGFISNKEMDLATVFITFKNKDNYTIEISPSLPPQNDLADDEYEKVVQEYKQTDQYTIVNSVSTNINWFSSLLMGYDDNVQLAKKVLNSDKRTIEMIETYWAGKFYSGYQDTTYSRRLAEATLALVSRYTIEDISITHNEFNSSMQCIVSRLYIQIVDVNNKIGHISASCFNTPKGYQIIPKSVNITYDWRFDEVIAEAYVNSLNNSFR